MSLFLRISITIVLLLSTSSAVTFRDMHKISLKKDEQTKILVKYRNFTKVFELRWTLFVNDGLVVFHTYDKKQAQNILYLNTTNQSFKVFLKPKGADSYEVPYFLVKFKEFDLKKNRALFEIYLSDRERQVLVEYFKNKRK